MRATATGVRQLTDNQWEQAPSAIGAPLERFHLHGASPSALRLDASEKRSSRVFVLVSSAWVPVTHASVAPFRRVFQTAAVEALAVGRTVDAPRKRKTLRLGPWILQPRFSDIASATAKKKPRPSRAWTGLPRESKQQRRFGLSYPRSVGTSGALVR